MQENYLKKELYDLIKQDSSIFEFIQSGSLDGIWYWDLEKPENRWMSHKYWETLGYDPSEKKHLTSEWQGIIFEEDLELALDNFEKHCADPKHLYDQIVRYKHKNGSIVWIRCRGLAIKDEDGKVIRMLGAHADITDLKEAEKEISRLKEEYEIVFNGTQDAMFLISSLGNKEFRYIRCNHAYQTKTGRSSEQIINKSPQELFGQTIGDRLSRDYQKCVERKKSITYEEKMNLSRGERVWLTTLTPIMEDGRITHIVGSGTDITERKKLEVELEKSANYDMLTGLPNRRLFFERLDQMVLENARDKTQFALLFIDLDEFKEINDNYGHEVGDKVLITVGKRLLESIRKSDTVARMGGDEFTVLLRQVKDKKGIDHVVKKIQTSLRKVMQIGDVKCCVDSSIGAVIYPDNGEDSEALLRNADASMYNIKRDQKARLSFFKDE